MLILPNPLLPGLYMIYCCKYKKSCIDCFVSHKSWAYRSFWIINHPSIVPFRSNYTVVDKKHQLGGHLVYKLNFYPSLEAPPPFFFFSCVSCAIFIKWKSCSTTSNTTKKIAMQLPTFVHVYVCAFVCIYQVVAYISLMLSYHCVYIYPS